MSVLVLLAMEMAESGEITLNLCTMSITVPHDSFIASVYSFATTVSDLIGQDSTEFCCRTWKSQYYMVSDSVIMVFWPICSIVCEINCNYGSALQSRGGEFI